MKASMSTPHIPEESLEQYAMGALSGGSNVAVEEHLLYCESCQARLVAFDEFLTVFRAAAAQADARPAPAWRSLLAPRKVWWAGAAAAAAALVIAFTGWEPRTATPAPGSVMMESMRGPEAGARIAAGKPYRLVFDVPMPAPLAESRIEVVNGLGKAVLSATPEVKDGRLAALIPSLPRGTYWVRVYRGAGEAELLAEYGLRAE
jgi:anti-sigma factor RsiW